MEKIFIVLAIFITLNIIFYKTLNGFVKKQSGNKGWKLGGGRFFFWEGALTVSSVGTFVIIYILKLSNILTF